jgi:hypothetical protein
MMAGGDLSFLQTLLGHKTAAMVQRCAHLDHKHLQFQVERRAASRPNALSSTAVENWPIVMGTPE